VDERAAHWLSVGNKAFKDGKFAEAEQAYREAFAIKKGFDIAGNLGAAQLAQGKLREGAQHLAYTLRMFPVTGEPALREQMQKAFDQCRQGVGAVRVKLDVKGAVVLVDGRPYGEAPLADEVFVDPGEHIFEARLEGYTGAPLRLRVDKGAAVEVALPLTRVKVIVVPPPVIRRSIIPGLGLAALAVVGLGGGAAFISMSASKRADAQVLRGQILSYRGSCIVDAANYDVTTCPRLQSALRDDDTFYNVAVGAFLVGTAAALGTAAYFLWPQRRPSVRVTPVVGAGAGGVLVSGSF
jgi:hypothetical protein